MPFLNLSEPIIYRQFITGSGPDGFKWLRHDGEHTMVDFKVNMRDTAIPAIEVDRTGPLNCLMISDFLIPSEFIRHFVEILTTGYDLQIMFSDIFSIKGFFCPEQSKAVIRPEQLRLKTR
jgi:hypothetical protein